ncbi:hypothetical protein E3T46_12910 [Cryobacterium sp. Hh11]|uniref:hypothetical protein n=1 Tax=Cryobacterium sp. Hh11 TaxID=2555868 RepID=UPI001068F1B9|nr:hypothetical protein [Cryobacterium sp. Hh11]TFD49749.1 hypothetical protein E3T46_12910 [Cryobacterium sp. Hh11]
MNIELWWPKLTPSTRVGLLENNGDAVPPQVVAEVTRAGGSAAIDSDSAESDYYLSDEDVEWIETVTNEEEPTEGLILSKVRRT